MKSYKIFPEPSLYWSEENPVDVVFTDNIEKVLSDWLPYMKTWNPKYQTLIAISEKERIEIS